MSASLVGSEMCIRDRGRVPELRRLVAGGRQELRAVGREDGATDRAVAVSYTHLTLPTICSV
eukprot:9568903-Alexandrium_andersonii.AAC.1